MLRNYFFPLVAYVLLFYLLSSDNIIVNALYAFFLIVGFVTNRLFNRTKYLAAFSLLADTLEISYYNVFLQKEVQQIEVSSISGVEITKANPIGPFPGSLNLRVGDDWFDYAIISKPLKKDIEQFITATNIDFSE